MKIILLLWKGNSGVYPSKQNLRLYCTSTVYNNENCVYEIKGNYYISTAGQVFCVPLGQVY